jgi:hypothetical protein
MNCSAWAKRLNLKPVRIFREHLALLSTWLFESAVGEAGKSISSLRSMTLAVVLLIKKYVTYHCVHVSKSFYSPHIQLLHSWFGFCLLSSFFIVSLVLFLHMFLYYFLSLACNLLLSLLIICYVSISCSYTDLKYSIDQLTLLFPVCKGVWVPHYC